MSKSTVRRRASSAPAPPTKAFSGSGSDRRRLWDLLLFCGWILGAFAVVAPAVAGGPPLATDDEPGAQPAYHLEKGSLARSRIVALGRDLLLEGQALSHAVVISGDAHVSGDIEGDLIILGGDAHLAATATVGGDVYVLGGEIDLAGGSAAEPSGETVGGAVIGGRSVAYPEAADLWVTLIGGPAMGLPSSSRVVLGAKLALLAFWSFLVLFLLAIGRREILSTSDSVQIEPFRNFFVGLTGVAAMVLTALFFSAFSGALLGVPLLALVAVVALVLRFWGMVAVFHALGAWLHRRVGRGRPSPVTGATWGLLVLGLLKFLPLVGIWAWTVATFIGVGAALNTKLGRREPWLEA